MPVVVLAATKGGVGKTTLTASLAVEAARHGRVAIIDCDPQQSLARWHELRQGEGGIGKLVLLDPGKYADETAAKAVRDGYDWVLIDTPPALILKIEAAIMAADLVLVPARPSPLDVESIDPVVELCNENGKPFVFVLTQTVARSTMTDGARRYLAKSGDVLELEISSRQVHASAMLRGLTPAEIEPKGVSAAEMAKLWAVVEGLVNPLAGRKGLAQKKKLA